ETESPYIYCAIENIGDIHLRSTSNDDVIEYIEEDKDYAIGTSFSLNSMQVIKTLVGFVDAWHRFELSPTLYFGFCTTATITKEKRTTLVKRLGINLPATPILQLLESDRPVEPNDLSAISAVIRAAYEKEYSRHKTHGYLDSLQNWTESTWQEFLNRITWYFGEEDENILETELTESLKKCSFYNDRLRGKEGHVISLLVDKFDKKQNLPDFADRFVHSSEIMLVAKQVESGEYRLSDPAWEMWKKLPPPTDKRNLIDKVQSVCTEFNEKLLSSWCRSATLSRFEQNSFKHDKSILSMRYRVFESCYDRLVKFIESNKELSPDKLEECVEELVNCAKNHIDILSEDYSYALGSPPAIRGMIFELIDSCFLSFDDNGATIE
ncbi:hypothetical protein KA005_38660, partial [bacterium]|nr:hypothetical protein [bacterium]